MSPSLRQCSLGLDGDEDAAYRFVELPCGSLMAYGGDDGEISCLRATEDDKEEFVSLHRFDDSVRAVAVSNDGKRVAVGFDSGSTRIYTFENTYTHPHPFAKPPKHDDDDLMSQDISSQLEFFAGPQFDGPIRDLKFIKDYWLAVASESGMCVAHVDSADSLSERKLEKEVQEHHDHCGIRGVAVKGNLLATLAMDGRLCVWDFESSSLLIRESTKCIPKKDIGEVHGADPFDRSCRPLFFRNFLGTPGQLLPVLRTVKEGQVETLEVDESEVKDEGHIEPVVSLAATKDYVVTSGRDSRVVLWQLQDEKSWLPLETASIDAPATDLLVREGKVHATMANGNHLLLEFKDLNAKKKSVKTMESTERTATAKPKKRLNSSMEGFEEEEDDDDFEESKMTTKKDKPEKTKNPSKAAFEDDEDEDGDDDLDASNMSTKKDKPKETNASTAEFEDDEEDDLEACEITTAKEKPQKAINDSMQEFEDDDEDEGDLEANKSTKEKTKKTINTSMAEFEDDEEEDDLDTGKEKKLKKLKKKAGVSTAADDDDDDDDEIFDDTQSAKPTNRVRFVDDEADDDDGNENDKENAKNNEALDADMAAADDDDMPSGNDPTDIEHDEEDDDLEDLPTYSAAPATTVRLQPAFSPSSTPLDLTRRFLCWNHVGSVTLLQGDNDRNTVDIHFTDSAYKRPISFTDNMNFILGALGEDGGIFASDLQEDDEDDQDIEGLDDLAMSERTREAVKKSHRKRQLDARPTGSSIFFYRFETVGKQREKDWYLNLPDGERVLGAACGEGWAAAMTSRRFLRLFTSGGNQSQVVWLKGDPVTVVGRSRFLAVVYHEETPFPDGTQKLGYTLWDAASFTIISEGSLSCISKGSSLTWLGFNNDCSLMAMDSDGMLSMLVSCGPLGKNWGWSPVLDTVGLRKSSDDQFWPVTVFDGKLVCVPLKGGNSYPDATRRPVTTTLSLRLPLARSSVPRNTALEELSVRSNMALAQKKIVKDIEAGAESDVSERDYMVMCAQVDKVTLKLFAATIDAEKLDRAYDLVHRLHLEKSYDLAIRIADSHRKLADLIEDAKEIRFALEDDLEEDDYDEEQSSPTTSFMSRLAPSRQISPDAGLNSKIKRSIDRSGGLRTKKLRVD